MNIPVYRDGDIDSDYVPPEPTPLQVALSHVQARLSAFTREVATQARLFMFDRLHKTHYLRIRRELQLEVKKERVCKSSGIYDLLRITGHRV